MKYAITCILLFITIAANNKPWEYPEMREKIVINIQVPDLLETIAYQESRNQWSAVNYNNNGTQDLGKYQINTIAFKELKQKYSMDIPDRDIFLSDTLMQKRYALALYHHNIRLLKSRGRAVNKKNIIKAWAVSGYNV